MDTNSYDIMPRTIIADLLSYNNIWQLSNPSKNNLLKSSY